MDAENKEDPVDYQACDTKEEQEDEEENICEPKVEEDEREDEDHQDDKICEPEVDQDDLKTTTMEEEYNDLVGDQISEAVTCLVEDMEETSEDEYVKEVNSYK